MTIYEIKRALEQANPHNYFFARKSMKFFNQTLKDFSVNKKRCPNSGEEFYKISAPSVWLGQTHYTIRYFAPSFPSVLFHTPPVKTAKGWEESNPNYPTQTEQNATNI
jgi:hypothetical protein